MNSYLKKFKCYFLLICAKLIYSFTSVFSKMASKEIFLSYKFCMYYFLVILVLGIYAILWQQVLKDIDLYTAMLFKPFVLILTVMWATILFDEMLSLKVIVGMIIIVIGIIIGGIEDEK